MYWVEEIKNVMRMIKKACNKDERWSRCVKCPFDKCCAVLVDYCGALVPEEWDID